MKENGLDGLIVTSHENIFYVSGSGVGKQMRVAPIIFPIDGNPVFLVHPSGSGAGEDIMVRQQTWIKDVRAYQGGEWAPLEIWSHISDVLTEKKLKKAKIGLELFDVPASSFEHLKKLQPKATFVDCGPMFQKMRSVKSPEELKILSEANMLTAKAVTIAFEMARPGDTEKKIAQNMIRLMMDYGTSKIRFLSLAAGTNVVKPHNPPGDYKIKKGDMVHVDIGGTWKGYGSDISRMAVVGNPTKKQIEAFNVIIKQMWDTVEAMQNGAPIKEVNQAAKESYESHGGKYPRYFIGHSSGLGVHEHPYIAPFDGEWILEPNMFFQLEPSHVVSDKIRVHYEDGFIIQQSGPAKNISEYRSSRELLIIK
jgi:Xaa-Pro dipeptidase